MLEVEVKHPVADFAAIEAQLRAWGAVEIEDRRDRDTYLRPPDRDFGATGEAFRLRCIGARNFVTYKGPRRDGPTKTREELELPLADGLERSAEYLQLFGHLGYQPVRTVEKQRRVFECQREGVDLQICLDTVEGLGQFVELEAIADDAGFERAQTAVLATAQALGLGPVERRSYLGLLLARDAEASA